MLHAFQREKENNDREIVLDSDENLWTSETTFGWVNDDNDDENENNPSEHCKGQQEGRKQ